MNRTEEGPYYPCPYCGSTFHGQPCPYEPKEQRWNLKQRGRLLEKGNGK